MLHLCVIPFDLTLTLVVLSEKESILRMIYLAGNGEVLFFVFCPDIHISQTSHEFLWECLTIFSQNILVMSCVVLFPNHFSV